MTATPNHTELVTCPRCDGSGDENPAACTVDYCSCCRGEGVVELDRLSPWMNPTAEGFTTEPWS